MSGPGSRPPGGRSGSGSHHSEGLVTHAYSDTHIVIVSIDVLIVVATVTLRATVVVPSTKILSCKSP